MHLDSHLHFWHYNPGEYAWIDDTMAPLRRDFMPEDALGVMQPAGVDGCVVVQVRQTLEETRWMLQLAERYAFIAGVVGWVDLRSDALDAQIQSIAHPKLVGVRHIVQAEADDFLLDERFRGGVARLERHGLAYDMLIYARQMSAAIEFASRLPSCASSSITLASRISSGTVSTVASRSRSNCGASEHLREAVRPGDRGGLESMDNRGSAPLCRRGH
jgi:L-fuconolactonase